jgi:hypothetical protein
MATYDLSNLTEGIAERNVGKESAHLLNKWEKTRTSNWS